MFTVINCLSHGGSFAKFVRIYYTDLSLAMFHVLVATVAKSIMCLAELDHWFSDASLLPCNFIAVESHQWSVKTAKINLVSLYLQ